MSSAAAQDRLLTFELAGSLYALPIVGVLEVAEAAPLSLVPTLPIEIGGVVNHHGDALPVLSQSALLGVSEGTKPAAQLVVVTDGSEGDGSRLGLPVDRVIGLAPGKPAQALGGGPIAERRNLGGRMVNVIDPQRLLARARELIANASAAGGATAPPRGGNF